MQRKDFYQNYASVSEPEEKEKLLEKNLQKVFNEEAKKII